MRLFAAIGIPEEIKDYFSRIQQQIGNDNAKVNWVKKENLHITLKFLGEVKEESLEKIKGTLKKIRLKPFSLTIGKLGIFPNENYIKVIWIGFKKAERLFDLHKLVDMSLSRLVPIERNFLGHITLGRVKFVKDKQKFKEKLDSIRIQENSFKVDKFKLYKSELTKHGPVYEVLEEFS